MRSSLSLLTSSVLISSHRAKCPVYRAGHAFWSQQQTLTQTGTTASCGERALCTNSSVRLSMPAAMGASPRPSMTMMRTVAGTRAASAFFTPSASILPQTHQYRSIVVETNETPNPDSLRFFSMELSFLPEGQSMDMPNNGHAYKSPLAEILFALDGVKALYFSDEYITVTKESDSDWAEIGTLVKEAITQFAESGVSILSAEGEEEILPTNWDTDPSESDTEVVLAIKELLASRIRPMVQGDGGNVRFIGFDEADGMVFVMLEGACKSCPSSGQTLKFGIERMLMHWIPEVTEVQEVDEQFAEDYKRQQQAEREKKEKEEAAASEGATSPS